MKLDKYENEHVLSTDGWQSGTYIVSLIKNDGLIESRKINVLK